MNTKYTTDYCYLLPFKCTAHIHLFTQIKSSYNPKMSFISRTNLPHQRSKYVKLKFHLFDLLWICCTTKSITVHNKSKQVEIELQQVDCVKRICIKNAFQSRTCECVTCCITFFAPVTLTFLGNLDIQNDLDIVNMHLNLYQQ